MRALHLKVLNANHMSLYDLASTKYFIPFQVGTLITSSILGTTMDSRRQGFYGWFGITQPIFDSDNRFVASPFLPPLVLGLIRLVFAIYMTACVIIDPILLKKSRRTRRDAIKFPAYFTNISFISLAWFLPLHSFLS